jgi:hypothetical protein
VRPQREQTAHSERARRAGGLGGAVYGPIGSGAGKHLVDAEHVVGVGAHAHVEVVLAGELLEVLVDDDAARLKRLRAQLLLLAGEQVSAEGELLHASLLASDIVDADLGIYVQGKLSGPPRAVGRGRAGAPGTPRQ